MGALALFFPFFIGSVLTELAAWLLGAANPWGLVFVVAAALSLLGVVLGLWVRARYQEKRTIPSLSCLVLLLSLGLLLAEFTPLSSLRVLCWSLAFWVGLRWLPKAIWQIGSMC
jgi:uncharacterized membrane protein YfcA